MKKIIGFLTVFLTFFAFKACSPKDVVEAYPEVPPDNIVWERYPQENMFGLNAIGKSDEHDLTVTMESNALGELEEGDYRVEYGDLDVNFKMTMQTFEVW